MLLKLNGDMPDEKVFNHFPFYLLTEIIHRKVSSNHKVDKLEGNPGEEKPTLSWQIVSKLPYV